MEPLYGLTITYEGNISATLVRGCELAFTSFAFVLSHDIFPFAYGTII
jgi:hypothetical protein